METMWHMRTRSVINRVKYLNWTIQRLEFPVWLSYLFSYSIIYSFFFFNNKNRFTALQYYWHFISTFPELVWILADMKSNQLNWFKYEAARNGSLICLVNEWLIRLKSTTEMSTRSSHSPFPSPFFCFFGILTILTILNCS